MKIKKALLYLLFFIFIVFSYKSVRFLVFKYEASISSQKLYDSTTKIQNERYDYIQNKNSDKGIIIYQGANVDHKAYIKLAIDLAKQTNYNVFLAKNPFEIAFFDSKIDLDIIKERKEIKSWYLLGHSLGGAVLSSHLDKSNKIKGMIFLGSYPIKKSKSKKPMLYLFSENDGLITKRKRDEKWALRSENKNNVKYIIKGGNHANFGDYGFQEGDNKAIISNDEQRKEILEQIKKFLDKK